MPNTFCLSVILVLSVFCASISQAKAINIKREKCAALLITLEDKTKASNSHVYNCGDNGVECNINIPSKHKWTIYFRYGIWKKQLDIINQEGYELQDTPIQIDCSSGRISQSGHNSKLILSVPLGLKGSTQTQYIVNRYGDIIPK